MANVARVRVEAKRLKNDSYYEREKNFQSLFKEFKRLVSDAGIMHLVKENEYYQSKGEKARKKRKESNLKRQQEIILEAIERGESPKGAAKFKSKKKKNNSRKGSD